jgi:tyrosinase
VLILAAAALATPACAAPGYSAPSPVASRGTEPTIAIPSVGAPATTVPSIVPTTAPPRIRKDISTLGAAEIAALRRGVAVMKSRSATDPTSWAYQANIHGTVDGPPQQAWSTCQHGNFHFLSWHRMYLAYFERILRAASGDDTLTLPYWNYAAPGQRALPEAFRLPADATNALFVTERAPGANAGGLLPASAVESEQALVPTVFFSTSPIGTSFGGGKGGGSGTLERQPHNIIHVVLGGSTGWMSDPDFAAKDPIFWLHHANIDRLWTRWIARGGGRANPTDSDWTGTKFTFFNESGTPVEMTGQEILDTVAQLDYRYDDSGSGGPPEAAGIPVPRQGATPESLSTSAQPMELKGQKARASVPLTALHRESLNKTGEAERGVVLTFEGITYDQNPGIYYEVYLGLPESETPDPKGPYYVGNLAVFANKPHAAHTHAGHVAAKPEISLDATRTIRALRSAGKLPSGALGVTFIPRGLTKPGTTESAPITSAPPLRFERVRISTY